MNKKFILIDKKMEPTYFRKFMAPMLTQYDVDARGFEITIDRGTPEVLLKIQELPGNQGNNLFGEEGEQLEEDKIIFELR
ncbi:MAG TPA: hypothetical protein DCL81_16810, partial [Algoriphagus sp.]|nr:hypothetical protein [Algoriphagus sp.]